MIRSNLRLKTLGLCAMALGLMAFGAAGAQAEPTAKWWINGAPIGASHLLPFIEIKELENKTATLKTKIAGATVEYLCTEAKLTGAKLELEGKITAGAKILLHGCVVRLNGVLSPGCVPKTTGQPNGLVLIDGVKGLLKLHGSEDVVEISPVAVNLRFAQLRHNPATCALPEVVPIFGHIVLHDPIDQALIEEPTHLFLEHSLTHLWVISLTVEHEATITGSAILRLGGAHEGLKWKGVPG